MDPALQRFEQSASSRLLHHWPFDLGRVQLATRGAQHRFHPRNICTAVAST